MARAVEVACATFIFGGLVLIAFLLTDPTTYYQ